MRGKRFKSENTQRIKLGSNEKEIIDSELSKFVLNYVGDFFKCLQRISNDLIPSILLERTNYH